VAGFLLINPRSGKGSPSAEELDADARRLGIETHVMREGEDPAELARAADADVLGVAGGDGSLAPVAGVAIERDAGFVCIPFGTRNHFARDLGLDRDDPIGALRAFGGSERRVDVGRADDRVFLNNVSLGLYARLVHRREGHRRRREALARLRAWAILLTHRHPLGITINGHPVESRLYVYTPDADPSERSGERFVVDSERHRLAAAVDGEPVVLDTRVEFTIEPRALRVLVPPEGD
jgi:diacylglycerol kinase family enzyme